MKTVYYKSGDAEWKYELDDREHDDIVRALAEQEADLDQMVDEALDVLRDLAAVGENELTDDDIADQTLAVAILWHYFNSREGDAFGGDIVVIDAGPEEGATILPASELMDEDEDEADEGGPAGGGDSGNSERH